MVVGEFTTEIDVLVIGAGPGGYVAAIRAAQLGKKVLIADKAELGGVCLNRGCIPSKALISAAHRYEELSRTDMGISADGVQVDFSQVQTWKQGVVNKLTGGVGSLLKGNGVEAVQGEALFVSPTEVRIFQGNEFTRYKFNHCIIATGSRSTELKAFPYGGRILSSTEALRLKEIPKSMVVIGGGYIGIELGQTFAKFGTKVMVIEGADQVLPIFESEIVRWVQRKLKKDGVVVHTKAKALSATQSDSGVTVKYEAGGETKEITADYLLVTVGRSPNTDELGLEEIGLKKDERGYIQVDQQCRTNIENIYAIGDVVPGPALAHKASYEGKVAAEVIAGHKSAVDYKCIPAIVFCDPEIASVGLSETEAKDKGYPVVTGKFNYAANGRALSLNANEGFVKLVAHKENGLLIGGQIVGPGAPDLIAELGLAIEMGATLEDIALTIHAHPTLGEMVAEVAENALGQGVHTISK